MPGLSVSFEPQSDEPDITCLPFILESLENAETRAAGAWQLASLLDSCKGETADALGDFMREAGALELLAEVLDKQVDSTVARLVLMALGNMSSDAFDPNAAASRAILAENSIVKRISPFLLSSDKLCCMYAVAVVQNLCTSPAMARSVVDEDMHLVLDSLCASTSSARIRSFAAGALINIQRVLGHSSSSSRFGFSKLRRKTKPELALSKDAELAISMRLGRVELREAAGGKEAAGDGEKEGPKSFRLSRISQGAPRVVPEETALRTASASSMWRSADEQAGRNSAPLLRFTASTTRVFPTHALRSSRENRESDESATSQCSSHGSGGEAASGIDTTPPRNRQASPTPLRMRASAGRLAAAAAGDALEDLGHTNGELQIITVIPPTNKLLQTRLPLFESSEAASMSSSVGHSSIGSSASGSSQQSFLHSSRSHVSDASVTRTRPDSPDSTHSGRNSLTQLLSRVIHNTIGEQDDRASEQEASYERARNGDVLARLPV
mmetsp:Transcript_16583/g.35606  ORF Transcript_16583/g.35606 Transcript_16583/m.35606 type:complete len:498 (-) Transcript_16583:127-1620(-)